MATQLPALPEVERLAAGCIRILGGNPGKFTLQGTNTYLLGTGPRRLLIDTGEGKPSWIAALKRVLAEERASIDSAILTHWHRDHTGGVPDLLQAWPGVPVYKRHPEPGQRDIADGQTFAVEGACVRAVHTPGHTADHVVLLWERQADDGDDGPDGAESDVLFTGDSVLGHGTAVFEDLAEYLASLERMRRLFRRGGGRAFPGHGAVVADGPGKIAEYIQHRAQREEQVLQTLRGARPGESEAENGGPGGAVKDGSGNANGAWTVMELVRSIYRDVPESLHPAAAGGVVQILQKLRKEGKVLAVADGDGERWRLAGSGSGLGRPAL
ncbi:8e198258-becf-4e2a-84b9-469a84e9d259 [Thermothielavioides terrestris]|uniref:8e198258-becf-4e2a-84b9-469a84e9d259 n=1 Tax=Thermothielavioides terrestris TaxID=2587410 RepID=A0A3S4F314_9PEZI|nr:8e198258-becf-4e2a-84b9-469a84e9d259 [Thermothielavioides terrestris]